MRCLGVCGTDIAQNIDRERKVRLARSWPKPGVSVMFEMIYAIVQGDDLFITSPVFFFLLVSPFLCLFVACIVRALKNRSASRKALVDGLGYKD